MYGRSQCVISRVPGLGPLEGKDNKRCSTSKRTRTLYTWCRAHTAAESLQNAGGPFFETCLILRFHEVSNGGVHPSRGQPCGAYIHLRRASREYQIDKRELLVIVNKIAGYNNDEL